MVPLDGLALEHEGADEREDRQRDDFLNDLQLHEIEGPTIDVGPYSVGRNHSAVLEQGNAPGQQYDHNQRPPVRYVHFR